MTPWFATYQVSLSFTIFQCLLKFISIDLVMPSNHFVLCHPHLLMPTIFPSIKVFTNESTLCIKWPKYWNFSFNISLSNEREGKTINLGVGRLGLNPSSASLVASISFAIKEDNDSSLSGLLEHVKPEHCTQHMTGVLTTVAPKPSKVTDSLQ